MGSKWSPIDNDRNGLKTALIARIGARGVSAALQAALILMMARSVAVESFGQYAVGFAVGAVVGATGNLGLNVHGLRIQGQDRPLAVANTLVLLAAVLALLGSLVIAGAMGLVGPLDPYFLAGSTAAACEVASESVISVIASREKNRLASALIVLRRGLALTSFWAIMAWSGNPQIAVWSSAITPILLVFGFLSSSRHRGLSNWSQTLRSARDAWGAQVAGQIAGADTIIVRIAVGDFGAGVYAGTARLTLPIGVVASSIVGVFMPRLVTAEGNQRVAAIHSMRKLAVMLASLFFIVSPAVAAAIQFALGDRYVGAFWIALGLMGALALSMISQERQAEFLTAGRARVPTLVVGTCSIAGLVAHLLIGSVWGVKFLGLVAMCVQLVILTLLWRGAKHGRGTAPND